VAHEKKISKWCRSDAIAINQKHCVESRKIQKGSSVSLQGANLKILVIDDSNTIRRSAEIFLKQGGYDVVLAEDGFDALAKVNDYEPQLIFCDILMPRLDGYQTCAIIKRNQKFHTVPVVMLSSKDGVFDKARGRMVGAQDYLTKPFTKDQLLQAVQQFGVVS
jgi:twitching motility two-component system response regulator PilG